jgi:diaminohydroxyphosphoribosylaminopyrimidine deaminase/5-amino-6-(5-phosphoribosylamino)uracil reductase
LNPEEKHHDFMRQALLLARLGIGLAAPNPYVGAVVVDAEGKVLGSGFHTYDGIKHAEVIAIEQAQSKNVPLKEATLYVNLEPCCHQGRTGPCTEAIISSGIKRVVAAMLDPNPLVRGKGIEQLSSAGIAVIEGVLEDEARKLNEAFTKYIRWQEPLVTLKAGMTLDGKIAPPPGESGNPTALGSGGATGGWITSETARAHVQELRHSSDALMVGVGTIIADDPLLTDRTGRPRRRPLLRVIVDSRLRLPLESRVVKTAQDDVLVLCSFAEEKRKREFEARGIRVEQVAIAHAASAQSPSDKIRRMPVRRRTGIGGPLFPEMESSASDGRPDMRSMMKRLAEMQITSLLIEGGALVNWAALAAGVVDKVFLYYAPKILAGSGSVPFARGAGFRHMGEAAHVQHVTIHHFGEDFAVEGYIRDPYDFSAIHEAE